MISVEGMITRIIDAIPVGAPLEGWLRRRGGGPLRAASQRALDTHMQVRKTTHMQPAPEIVQEQFEPETVVAFDVSALQPDATGPSPERRAALIAERDALTPKTWSRNPREAYMAKDRIKEINKELAGNADQKEVLRWIKARAAKSPGGAFDPDTVAAAFRFMPGWSIKETTGLIHINSNTSEALLVVLRGKRTRGLIEEDYQRAGWWHAEWPKDEPLPPINVVEGSTLRATKDRPLVAEPVAGAVYSARGADRRHWGATPTMLLYKPAVGVRVWMITAPKMGGDHPVFDKPWRRSDEPLSSPGFHKWGYTFGLGEAAQAALGAAEAAVPRAASTGDEWARNLCQVCFQAHALAPKARTLVDHAHRRLGWGYNVSPCFGAKHLSYAESCDLTRQYGHGLVATLQSARGWAATLAAGVRDDGSPLTFRVKVYTTTTDRYGRVQRVQETNPELSKQFGFYKVEDYTAQPGKPLWAEARKAEQSKVANKIASLVGSIPFYRAAVRLWRPAAPDAKVYDVLSRIRAGIEPADKVGL